MRLRSFPLRDANEKEISFWPESSLCIVAPVNFVRSLNFSLKYLALAKTSYSKKFSKRKHHPKCDIFAKMYIETIQFVNLCMHSLKGLTISDACGCRKYERKLIMCVCYLNYLSHYNSYEKGEKKQMFLVSVTLWFIAAKKIFFFPFFFLASPLT